MMKNKNTFAIFGITTPQCQRTIVPRLEQHKDKTNLDKTTKKLIYFKIGYPHWCC